MNDVASYDIAVSFADERRSYVEEVVEACKQRGIAVCYDRDKTNEWWARNIRGDHGAVEAAEIRYFVPFISTEYLAKPSQVDEFAVAMMTAVKLGAEHVLPVLVGDAPVPAELLHPHIGYLRSEEHPPEQLAEQLAARIDRAAAAGQQPRALTDVVTDALRPSQPVAIPADFSKYGEQEQALRYLGEQFQAAAPRLRSRGFVATVRRTESLVAIRIERRGDTVYALDIQRGGMGGDETVNFVVGLHDASSTCSNGWARPVYDQDAGVAKLEMHDLSVFGNFNSETRGYTRDELFSALWQRITGLLKQVSR
jgi:hypothetical protein